jgi:hypothetical protein
LTEQQKPVYQLYEDPLDKIDAAITVIDPMAPVVLPEDEFPMYPEVYEMKGRNSRIPKKANHGARPCSSMMRKAKKKGWYHKISRDV